MDFLNANSETIRFHFTPLIAKQTGIVKGDAAILSLPMKSVNGLKHNGLNIVWCIFYKNTMINITN